ncbi:MULTISPECIES: YdgA family protein [Pseudomonas]|uniref:Protein YdgA n=1 Tax=Pseudomonas luteola TaxID=47886 RepID=A0A2X2D0H4_PSELU|nr:MULTISPECIES: YdgA family protein [Pseudomonas]ENA33457.1 hypothetical protein HMPREF1487_06225 [Pseudomonas sp. HPB0071]MBF8641554.1 YdgA family protein [Pseudomonas zeshuii]RRW47575.1 DUF945 domain-containing protein [Pseudomonas luteola]SHJ16223.1 Uncharacterized conserved protein YdgA, DUF945 family [Pseudomonas zeshuii]SPZ12814.1 protein YdgA [Pseudomonas luteola]
MKKAAGIAVGVALVVGAVAVGGAWYTSTQLEGALNQAIDQTNAQWAKTLPDQSAHMELVSLDKGLFKSTAHYRIVLPGSGLGLDTPIEVLMVDHLEHGPFPASRLASFKLAPVMASSHFALESSPSLQAWFTAANNAVPAYGTAVIGYDQQVNGTLTLQPFELNEDERHVAFAGATLGFKTDLELKRYQLDLSADSLVLTSPTKNGAMVSTTLKGMRVTADRSLGQSGLYTGRSDLGLQSMQIQGDTLPPVVMRDITAQDNLQEHGLRLADTIHYTLGGMTVDGKEVGSGRMSLSFRDIDAAALQGMATTYSQYAERVQIDPETQQMPAMLPEERARMQSFGSTLLAANPVVTLDELSFKTAHGESRFNMAVNLTRPAEYDHLSPAEVYQQMISRLDMQLRLSKPMIADLLALKNDPSQDVADAAQDAKAAGEAIGDMAASSQMARVEGDDIVATLNYADQMVDFNGQKMTPEQFAMLMQNTALAAITMSALAPQAQ